MKFVGGAMPPFLVFPLRSFYSRLRSIPKSSAWVVVLFLFSAGQVWLLNRDRSLSAARLPKFSCFVMASVRAKPLEVHSKRFAQLLYRKVSYHKHYNQERPHSSLGYLTPVLTS